MHVGVVFIFTWIVSTASAAEWWKTAIFYQIYPRSFKDSDNDGIGDIPGITSKLDYLQDIGVTALWLSPIYKSPMADFGYDISDYQDVDPLFGTLADMKQLISELKKRHMYIIMDFVPNHSSDEHPWFNMSVNKQGNYTDFYVWKDPVMNGNQRQPPNNWQSVFSGSAWEWNEKRQQYYLHDFVVKQPDLNYRNPAVVKEMKDIVQFWLDLGVDGFRVDAVKYLVEDENFPDEPLINSTAGLTYENLDHIYTTNQPLTFDVIAEWSELVRQLNEADGRDRIMFMEVYNSIPNIMRYYGNSSYPFQIPFNFILLEDINQGVNAVDMVTTFNKWLDNMPAGATVNWVVGNHDNSRVSTRVGSEMVDTVNMIMAMLPGIMITYNGEEIGMSDTYLRFDETVDPSGTLLGPGGYTSGSRDPERTPFQWDDTVNAGFSKNKTWLPVNPNYWSLNAAAQSSSAKSHLKVYRSLSQLRQTATFLSNTTAYEATTPDNNTLVIKRWSDNGDTYVLIANLASTSATIDYSLANVTQMVVYVASINSEYMTGDKVTLSGGVTLRPKAAVILSTGTALPSSAVSSAARPKSA